MALGNAAIRPRLPVRLFHAPSSYSVHFRVVVTMSRALIGQLSLASLRGRLIEYQLRLG